MKQLATAIRSLIATRLLGWACQVAPHNKDGDTLRVAVMKYLEYSLKRGDADNGE